DWSLLRSAGRAPRALPMVLKRAYRRPLPQLPCPAGSPAKKAATAAGSKVRPFPDLLPERRLAGLTPVSPLHAGDPGRAAGCCDDAAQTGAGMAHPPAGPGRAVPGGPGPGAESPGAVHPLHTPPASLDRPPPGILPSAIAASSAAGQFPG